MRKVLRIFMMIAGLIGSVATHGAEVRIKDITTVEGARPNQLFGKGLVIGLNNTGARTASTQQAAIDLLRRLEQTTTIARQSQLDPVFKSNNISTVIVTAELHEFARKGSRLDIDVSVIDDATSLEGGKLILTPLQGVDGEVYAVAQGNLSIGGVRIRGVSSGGQLNHPTVGRIPGGAIVEREAPGEINHNGCVRLLLRQPDAASCSLIVKSINEQFPGTAKTINPGTLQVRIPADKGQNVTEFIGEIGLLKTTPDAAARVVINERTGTVVVGGNVRVTAASIAHANLVINPNMSSVPRQGGNDPSRLPNPPTLLTPPKPDDGLFGGVPVPPMPGDSVPITPPIEKTYTVAELIRVLNALGVSPRDLIAIFQELDRAGLLHAELVIM